MRFWPVIDAAVNGLPSARSRLGVQVTDWTTSSLDQLVWADILGPDVLADLPLTRAAAMRIPAVVRARNLLAGTVARLPLLALRGDERLDRDSTPTWLYASDGQLGMLDPERVVGQSVYHRMLATVDDHLFYGASLWWITARDANSFPARCIHIPFLDWGWNSDDGFTGPDGRPLPNQADLVFIPGGHEGILNYGQVTLRQASDLERAASDVAAHPFRLELHQTTETPLTDDEKRAMVNAARRAMNANGGVLYTNSAIETKDHPIASGDLLVAGRNQTAVDTARLVSIPASMIDATAAGASLTYETAMTRNLEFIDYGLTLYMDPIAARLSMDDMVPRGLRIAFDTSGITSIPPTTTTGPSLED